MEIEEYRPEPAKPQPAAPVRKELSLFKLGVFMVVAFLVTLAVLSRNELAALLHKQHGRTPAEAVQSHPQEAKVSPPDSHSAASKDTAALPLPQWPERKVQ